MQASITRWQQRTHAWRRAGVVVALVATLATAVAAPELSQLFADHMVLQQQMPVPVWGRAEPGEKVVVRFAGQTKRATADAEGRWRVTLKALKASDEPRELTVQSGDAEPAVRVQDVLVGEVWLCSGQSNMQFELHRAENGGEAAATADCPRIRFFQVVSKVAAAPLRDVKGAWRLCTPQTASNFSAVAYFYGRELQAKLGVPIGLVHASQGWTPGEAWMSREALLAVPELRYIAERWDAVTADYPRAQEVHTQAMETWRKAEAAAKQAGTKVPPQPKAPIDPMFLHRASGFYNGAIAPLAPMAMRGVIWYQGETNEVRGREYGILFPALIRDWRRTWDGREFPFLFVQVASVLPPDPEPVPSEWAELRESQAMALAVPKTGMACTIDIGEEKDVHPKNKLDVGRRLARVARARVYGEKKLVHSGPIYSGMQVEGSRIRVRFKELGGGLVCRGEALKTFAIAGADRKFVNAQAEIDGDSVVVWSEAVADPVAVRYAWANNPEGCNLYNQAGLPALPFRTDTWPGKTDGYRKLFVDQ